MCCHFPNLHPLRIRSYSETLPISSSLTVMPRLQHPHNLHRPLYSLNPLQHPLRMYLHLRLSRIQELHIIGYAYMYLENTGAAERLVEDKCTAHLCLAGLATCRSELAKYLDGDSQTAYRLRVSWRAKIRLESVVCSDSEAFGCRWYDVLLL